jgi:hypothetical protein
MPSIALLGLSTMFLVACAGPKGLSVTIKGEKTSVAETTSVAIVRPDLRELQVLVANFPVDLSRNIMGSPQAKNKGEMKVVFHVKGDGKDFKMPVEVGEYAGAKVTTAYVSRGGESSDLGFIDSGKPANGKVVIQSIQNQTVTGSIDVKHGDDAIVGAFTAKIVPDR